MSELKGETYQERADDQLENWVKGVSICNKIDGECCPDFSCCTGEIVDEETRKVFAAAHRQGRLDITDKMLMGFLASAFSTTNVKIHIAGDTSEMN